MDFQEVRSRRTNSIDVQLASTCVGELGALSANIVPVAMVAPANVKPELDAVRIGWVIFSPSSRSSLNPICLESLV